MMKKVLAVITILTLLLLPGMALAVESVTQTYARVGQNTNLATLTFDIVTAADGSLTATATNTANTAAIAGWYVYMVVTNPGGTAPQDDYDITIVDSDGVDIMGGALSNRDTANTEQALPYIGSAYAPRPIASTLTGLS